MTKREDREGTKWGDGTTPFTDPALWERLQRDNVAGDQGGRPGQWSAREA